MIALPDYHRERCAVAAGISGELLLETIIHHRSRGGYVSVRRKLVVAMRDTPLPDGTTASWPSIARSLNLASHGNVIELYRAGKGLPRRNVKGGHASNCVDT